MKKYLLIIGIGLAGGSLFVSAKNCENAMTLKFLQDALDRLNIISPKTTDIQERIAELVACCDANNSQLDIVESLVEAISVSTSDALVLSKLDDLTTCCDANSSKLDIVESLVEAISVSTSDALVLSKLDDIATCCDANSSKLDIVESLVEAISVSSSDALVLSKLDDIATCCDANSSQLDIVESKVDVVGACCASSSDVLGEVTDIGSCLDSQIDVPDGINNLSLTVISLLKTILLDLRGCNIP